MGGGGASPPAPCSYGHEAWINISLLTKVSIHILLLEKQDSMFMTKAYVVL